MNFCFVQKTKVLYPPKYFVYIAYYPNVVRTAETYRNEY